MAATGVGASDPNGKIQYITQQNHTTGEIKYLQLVLETPTTMEKSAAAKAKPKPAVAAKKDTTIDATCTICGQHYVERAAFNAHIRAHLKEKLKQKQESKAWSDTPTPSPREEIPAPATPTKRKSSSQQPSPAKKTCNVDLMASLAACQPVPPSEISAGLAQRPAPDLDTLISPPKAPSEPLPAMPTPPAISDLEEDPMTYEMEMNRIDFHNDLSHILDQIEKDFESPGGVGLHDIRLDTPPDSDSENSDYLSTLLGQGGQLAVSPGTDLLGFDEFTRRISLGQQVMVNPHQVEGRDCLDQLMSDLPPTTTAADSVTVDHNYTDDDALVQSPSSLAKVGPLPPKALAVLNQLPAKIFLQKAGSKSRLVNVVKVERSENGAPILKQQPPPRYTVINIECQLPTGNNGETKSKIIESYRAIDTGSELKLIVDGGEEQQIQQVQLQQQLQQPEEKPEETMVTSPVAPTPSTPVTPAKPLPKSKSSSECTVCGKTITTKNMARHMEKHTGKKKFHCEVCNAAFFQKTHLKNHEALHQNECTQSCPGCVMKFHRRQDLNRHIRSVHSTGIPTQLSDGSTGYKCGVCDIVVSDRSAMSGHTHEDEDTEDESAAKPFTCNECNRSFAQKGHLNRHIKTHGRNEDLVCKVCDKQCKNRISLQRHRAKHLACTHCAKVFENRVALQEHLIREHDAPSSVESAPLVDSPTSVSDLLGEADFMTGLIGGGDMAAANNFFDFAQDLNDEFYPTDLF